MECDMVIHENDSYLIMDMNMTDALQQTESKHCLARRRGQESSNKAPEAHTLGNKQGEQKVIKYLEDSLVVDPAAAAIFWCAPRILILMTTTTEITSWPYPECPMHFTL